MSNHGSTYLSFLFFLFFSPCSFLPTTTLTSWSTQLTPLRYSMDDCSCATFKHWTAFQQKRTVLLSSLYRLISSASSCSKKKKSRYKSWWWKNKKKNLPAHYNGGNQGPQKSNLTFSYPFPAIPPYLQLTTPPQFPWPVCKMVWVKFASLQPRASRTAPCPLATAVLTVARGLADSRQCVV